MRKEHHFVLVVKNNGSRSSAKSAVYAAFTIRNPDGCEFHLKPYAKPFKVIRIGGPKRDPNDMLGKASEPENGWKGIGSKSLNLAGYKSPTFKTQTLKKWGNAK